RLRQEASMPARLLRMPAAIAAMLLLAVVPASVQEPAAVAAPPPEAPDAPFTAGISDAASLRAIVEGRIARARQSLDRLLAVKGARTAENTLRPYDDILAELDTADTESGLLAGVHPDENVRRAGDELDRRVQALTSEIQLRTDVYAALSAIRTDGLDADTRYYLARELGSLRRLGVDRPAATRARLQTLRDQLAAVMAEFQRNIREGQRKWTVSTKDLDGLPADFIARHTP